MVDMNTNTIVKQCLESLESVTTKENKHLYIFINYDQGTVHGHLQIENIGLMYNFNKKI